MFSNKTSSSRGLLESVAKIFGFPEKTTIGDWGIWFRGKMV